MVYESPNLGATKRAEAGAGGCRDPDGSFLPTALWRSEAAIPLPDHRTPPQWVDDLAVRFSALGIDPEMPP